jgi:glyceraldehyde 3-phosphate dehydrogenase
MSYLSYTLNPADN